MNKYAKMIIAMCFIVLASSTAAHEKVLIKEVTSLLLHRGKMTTGRRSAPVPQINCISNCNHSPDTIYCSNAGHDGEDVVWECKSDPAGVSLSNLNVQCEGYDYPDDPYILKGSCGIEFRMTSTPMSSPRHHTDGQGPNPLGGLCFLIIFLVFISCIAGDCGGSSSSYSPRYRSSSSDFWTGAATGYAIGSSGGGSSWGRSSNSSWGGGGSSSFGSSYASTSRR